MRNAKPVSVLLVAIVSAALEGGLAVLFVPALSFLFITISGPARLSDPAAERWMTVAVLAPLCCGVIGFGTGAFMASMFNLFVNQDAQLKPLLAERARMRAASIGDAA
jgi:hypothetical protein